MRCISTPIGSEADGTAPIWQATLPDAETLNAKMSAEILHWSESVADAGSFEADGVSYFDNKWLSGSSLQKSADTELQVLVQFIEETANGLLKNSGSSNRLSIKTMWSIVSKRGLTGRRHNHSGLISAVYFVEEGDSGVEAGGILQFYEQRTASRPTLEVVPKSGELLLFPSSLAHSVTAYRADRPRIVVSANLVLA